MCKMYYSFVKGCSGEWTAIVKNGADGTVINGSKRDLVDHLVVGDDIRISLNDSISTTMYCHLKTKTFAFKLFFNSVGLHTTNLMAIYTGIF